MKKKFKKIQCHWHCPCEFCMGIDRDNDQI